jgi:metal-responsive CopG/Arc/MetJ family transcriptional regulator
MKQGTVMKLEDKASPPRVSVPVTEQVLQEIDSRASRLGVSRSSFLARLLQYGLEAEQQKREELAQRLRRYRECTDPVEAERLGDELGEMIFGQ